MYNKTRELYEIDYNTQKYNFFDIFIFIYVTIIQHVSHILYDLLYWYF
jgi:hypothetical protein